MLSQITIIPYTLAGLLAVNSLMLPSIMPNQKEVIQVTQQPKFVSEKFARKWYDIGAQYKDSDMSVKNAIFDAYQKGIGEVDCWEKCAAFKAGKKGLPFKIKEWKRYGNIPMGSDGYAERSINHADNEPEDGVSAISEEWENSLRGQISINCHKRDIITFTGLQVGYGSDGEPVVLPVKQ